METSVKKLIARLVEETVIHLMQSVPPIAVTQGSQLYDHNCNTGQMVMHSSWNNHPRTDYNRKVTAGYQVIAKGRCKVQQGKGRANVSYTKPNRCVAIWLAPRYAFSKGGRDNRT